MKYETLHEPDDPQDSDLAPGKLAAVPTRTQNLIPLRWRRLGPRWRLAIPTLTQPKCTPAVTQKNCLGRAIRELGVDRQTLFIASKVLPSHLRYDDVLKACDNSLKRLRMDYIDLYLIHWPQAGMKLEETFSALNKLVHAEKVRHLGVSNFNLKLLQQSRELCETPLVTNQVPYSLSERSYVRNGVLEYCQQNDILLTAYEPVDKGRLNVNQALRSIADAHNATPYQIALAWLISQPRVITIPMSLNPQHIRENFESANIELTEEELKILG